MIWLVRLCMLPTSAPDDAGDACFLGPSRTPTHKVRMGSRALARGPGTSSLKRTARKPARKRKRDVKSQAWFGRRGVGMVGMGWLAGSNAREDVVLESPAFLTKKRQAAGMVESGASVVGSRAPSFCKRTGLLKNKLGQKGGPRMMECSFLSGAGP